MADRRKKTSWGGRRKGAGRKAMLKHPVRLSIDVEEAQVSALEAIASQREVSVAAVVREAVEMYLRRRRRR